MRFGEAHSDSDDAISAEQISRVELITAEGYLGDVFPHGSGHVVEATNHFHIKIVLKDGRQIIFHNKKKRHVSSKESYAANLAIHLDSLDLDEGEYESRRIAIVTMYDREFKTTLEKSIESHDFVARKYNEYQTQQSKKQPDR